MLDLVASFYSSAPDAAPAVAAAGALARGVAAAGDRTVGRARSAVRNTERTLALIAADARRPAAHSFAALIPGNSAAEIALTSGLTSFLSLYNTCVVARLILTWIPQTPQAIVSPLATIVDPALNLFRGVIPAIGGIDLSPILFFVLLDFMQSSAAALPCEMPKEGASAKAVAGGPRLPRRRAGRAVVVKRDR